MVVKSQINWNIKQLVKLVQKENVKFDNVVQRRYVWKDNVEKQSLYIHSILIDYPVPPFYAIKMDSFYDMLDGKQRSMTATDFYEGKFALTNVPEIEVKNDDGEYEMVDINGLTYEQLPEDLKDRFDAYTISVYTFDKCITDDEVADMFFRLNNGQPLTQVELTRVKAKSNATINEISKHELFSSALTAKAIEKYGAEDLVMKTYAMLYQDEPCLETKKLRPFISDADITDDDKEEMTAVFDRIFNIYNGIESKKIANKIVRRTHLVTMAPIMLHSINMGYSETIVRGWIENFFCEGRSTTVSAIYNENCRGCTGSKASVKKRLNEMNNSYKAYMKKYATVTDENGNVAANTAATDIDEREVA